MWFLEKKPDIAYNVIVHCTKYHVPEDAYERD